MEAWGYFLATSLLLHTTVAWHWGLGTALATTLYFLFGAFGVVCCQVLDKEKADRKAPLTRATIHDRLTEIQWKLLEERIRKVTPSGHISLSGGDGYFMNLTEDSKTRLKECGFVVSANLKVASFNDIQQSAEVKS